MGLVRGQNCPQMPLAEDQHPVGDLGILSPVGPGEQGKPAEHVQHRQVGESHRHKYRQCPTVRPTRSQIPNLIIPARARHLGQEP
jgi:hypothetical protein